VRKMAVGMNRSCVCVGIALTIFEEECHSVPVGNSSVYIYIYIYRYIYIYIYTHVQVPFSSTIEVN
jgi:hypothetical protein